MLDLQDIKSQLRKNLKILIPIVFLAFLLRIIGLPWGFEVNNYFLQPDEKQHVRVAMDLIDKIDSQFIQTLKIRPDYNAPGFGNHIALLGYPILKISGASIKVLFFTGRMLSLLYSILLIVLTYCIALLIFSDNKIALMSALFLSLFDLNVTYSHYGVPEITYVFWLYASIFFVSLFYNNLASPQKENILMRNKLLLVLIPFSISMTYSLKYDILPLFIFIIAASYLLVLKKISMREFLKIMFIVCIFIFFFNFLLIGPYYSYDNFLYSQKIQFEENFNAIKKDLHLIYNPIFYFFTIFSGTNLLFTAFFIYGLFTLITRTENKVHKRTHWLFSGYLILAIIILWNADAAFVRRANIFLPYIGIMSSYGFVRVIEYIKTKRTKNILLIVVCVYSVTYIILSQYNFLNDTRYQSSTYLKSQNFNKDVIAYSQYAYLESMPKGIPLGSFHEDVDAIVLHEAYYKRYLKSFISPLKVPECCDEVYHCKYFDCLLIQHILLGNSYYKLTKDFKVTHFFPERLLFKKLFGTYETFLGDILILENLNGI